MKSVKYFHIICKRLKQRLKLILKLKMKIKNKIKIEIYATRNENQIIINSA